MEQGFKYVPLAASQDSPSARTLVASYRRALPVVSRCATFEFEDVIAAVDAVDLVEVNKDPWSRRMTRLETMAPRLFAPALLPNHQKYDLLFVSAHSAAELRTRRKNKRVVPACGGRYPRACVSRSRACAQTMECPRGEPGATSRRPRPLTGARSVPAEDIARAVLRAYGWRSRTPIHGVVAERGPRGAGGQGATRGGRAARLGKRSGCSALTSGNNQSDTPGESLPSNGLERAWLVEAGGRIVFVGYADVQRSEGWLLQGIYTWPEARRRGFARAGAAALCRAAFDAGADHVQLAVVAGNRAAEALYRGLGFRPFAGLRTVLFEAPRT